MRKVIIAVMLLIGLAGCTGEPTYGDPGIDPVSPIWVLLKQDVTSVDKQNIEQRLQATPGVASVSSWPPDLQTLPPGAPQTYKVLTKDFDVYDQLKAGTFKADMKQLPGVEEVVFSCKLEESGCGQAK
ncbi:hypothetical protein [Actinoplanes sp. NPDC048796]|uniref:hypothetical protein n=1 Tax=Actinoplanes sp. NPDC048796 TaxID=3155640 RepID=UPI0034097B3A